MQTNMGMAGEFRVVVKREDGSVKTDTGYQKNLILNQGLDFFGGGNGSDMMSYCVIGSGNSTPAYTQNKLDTAIIGVSGSTNSTKYDYNISRDGNLYKTNRVCKYSFNNLNNANISEVGLSSAYSNATTYYLCTRALIKDSNGNPTTITVLSGEILEIYYKLWAVFDTTDKTGTINLLNGVGGSTPYNYIARIAGVGGTNIGGTASYGDIIGSMLVFWAGNNTSSLVDGDIGSVIDSPKGYPLYILGDSVALNTSAYVSGTYKMSGTMNVPINSGNGDIRSGLFITSMGFYQIRFGSVANDSPITKTNTQTLTIPIEISWGRYEGTL